MGTRSGGEAKGGSKELHDERYAGESREHLLLRLKMKMKSSRKTCFYYSAAGAKKLLLIVVEEGVTGPRGSKQRSEWGQMNE